MSETQTRVFISYSRTDSAFVDRLEDDLRAKNFYIWVDRRKIEGGQEFSKEIEKAIKGCAVLLVVLSPEAVASKYVRWEYHYALSLHMPVIPLEYLSVESVKSGSELMDLIDLHWIKFINNYEQALKELLRTLNRIEPKAVCVPEAVSAPEQPPLNLPSEIKAPILAPPISRVRWLTQVIPTIDIQKIIIVGLLVMLLIIGSSFGLRYFLMSKPTTTNATALTATAHANVTTIAHLKTRVTATTPTPTSTLAQLPNPYPPYTGKLVFNDPLSTYSGSFALNKGCTFTGGAYHVSASAQNFTNSCSIGGGSYKNFAFEIQLIIRTGDAGGIIFRYKDTISTYTSIYYNFLIHIDGSYELYIFSTTTAFKPLKNGFSPAIKQGENQLNVIAAVANGNHIDIYVNHQFVDSVIDNTISQGEVGVLAQEVGNQTEVVFSNAKVWAI